MYDGWKYAITPLLSYLNPFLIVFLFICVRYFFIVDEALGVLICSSLITLILFFFLLSILLCLQLDLP